MAYPNLPTSRKAISRAAAGLQRARVVVIGESTDAGHGSGDFYAGSYPGQIRSHYRAAGAQIAGSGLIPPMVGNNELNTTSYAVEGSWAGYGSAAEPSPIILTTAVGATLTLTATEPGTTVRVLVPNWAPAFTIKVDAAAPVTVTPVDSGPDELWWWESGVLPDTAHTVVLTSGASTSPGLPLAVFGMGTERASGVQVVNLGFGGSGAKSWNDAKAAYGSYVNIAKNLSPDLVILGWGGNDLLNGVTLGDYGTALRALCGEFSCDVIIRGLLDGSSAGIDTGPTNALMRTVAGEGALRKRSFVDILPTFGDYAQATARGYMADAMHPSRAGYSVFAQLIYQDIQYTPSVADAERAALGNGSAAAAKMSLADLRKAAHPNGEYAFWSSASGLTPASRFSLIDHKRKAMAVALGLTDTQAALLSTADLALRYWAL